MPAAVPARARGAVAAGLALGLVSAVEPVRAVMGWVGRKRARAPRVRAVVLLGGGGGASAVVAPVGGFAAPLGACAAGPAPASAGRPLAAVGRCGRPIFAASGEGFGRDSRLGPSPARRPMPPSTAPIQANPLHVILGMSFIPG